MASGTHLLSSSGRGHRMLCSRPAQPIFGQRRVGRQRAVRAVAIKFQFKTKEEHSQSSSRDVAVELANTSFSSRKLNATVQIRAPLEIVWETLTDYENLGKFIPGLVENRCLERRPQGCLLYQVGAQDVAMGVKFSAACTLEIQEYPTGIPDSLCIVDGDWDAYFPRPASSGSSSSRGRASGSSSSRGSGSESDASCSLAVRDISFSLVEGDFQAFKGVWRLEPGAADSSSTVLSYSLFVKPHPWLPVGLVQKRISSEVVNNLKAVRRHAEHVYRHQLKEQQQRSEMLSSSVSSSSSLNTSSTDAEGSSLESGPESAGSGL